LKKYEDMNDEEKECEDWDFYITIPPKKVDTIKGRIISTKKAKPRKYC